MTGEPPVRILVVDDEPGIREGCRRILAAEGFEVQTAQDGAIGLEAFRKQSDFAVVLVDLKMPVLGGMEFIEEAHKINEDTVMLVITAYASISTAVETTKRGAYAYLPKPFMPNELLLAVRNGLEKRALSIEARALREERERQLLEVAFERSRCSTVIDCMTDGVVVANRDGQVVLRNTAAARIMPDCGVAQLPVPVGKLSCEHLRRVIEASLSGGIGREIVSREAVIGESTYMVNASQVIDANGALLGAVAVLRDITAMKELEAAKSMFVSMVAHEVKSPLAAIEGYLNLMLSEKLDSNPGESRRIVSRALLRARTLREMISELMSLRAVETGHFDIRRCPIELKEVLEEAVQAYEEKARDKKIEMKLVLGESVRNMKVLADRNAISTIAKNLLDNAVKYTPCGGLISVTLQGNEPYARLTVCDNGIGIAPEDRHRIFDEFFRVRSEQTAGIAGTGLGLSLVKRLVDMHHGRITVQSAPGKGSEFVVEIPLAVYGGDTRPPQSSS